MTNDRSRALAGVGVVVCSSDGFVLVARRLAEQGQPFALPGGKLEPGESVEECAVRELAEETGLVVDLGSVSAFATVTVDGAQIAGAQVSIGALAADIEPRELEPGKVGDFAWIAPSDLPPDLYPASAALLDRLDRR